MTLTDKEIKNWRNNMEHRHKHADLIIEWAETGCTLQFLTNGCSSWQDVCGTPVWNENIEYRKKPEVVRYKRFVYKTSTGTGVSIDNYGSNVNTEASPIFVRWIDTEWQEVEI